MGINSKTNKEINIALYYKKYGSMVFRRCMDILKNEDQAYDAMQEVFYKLLKNLNRLDGRYPSSLLYRIATNTCLNTIAYQAKFSEDPPDEVLTQIACYDEAEERFIASNLLDKIFNKEKKSTREIAVLFYIDGLRLKEVAQEVGMSVSGVRKRLRILKAKIKDGV